MNYDLELLKKIPAEHYTSHNNKLIKVKDLFELLKKNDEDQKRNSKRNNNGSRNRS
jgi:hypothetical protein